MPNVINLPAPGAVTTHVTKVTGHPAVPTPVTISRDLLTANNAQILKTYGRTLTQIEAANYHFSLVEILALVEGRPPTTGIQDELEAKRALQARYPWAF